MRFKHRSAFCPSVNALSLTFWLQLDEKRRDADPDAAGLVDEEDFAIVKSMKEKKKLYRDSFEELKQVKSEVEYLNRLVDQCRSKLVPAPSRTFCAAVARANFIIWLSVGT